MPSDTLRDRARLAHMLDELVHNNHDHTLRATAAKLALKIAMREGDSSAATLASSISRDETRHSSAEANRDLTHLRATAQAIRRAISEQKTKPTLAPLQSLHNGLADPKSIEAELLNRIQTGELFLAQSIVTVGLSRHPSNPELLKISEQIQRRIEERTLPAPIPFPRKTIH